jgi:beta-galactosidase
MYSLPLDKINALTFKKSNPKPDSPVFKKGTFYLTATGDSYLDLSNWGKGCIWVNGHHLGRYWETGPQQTIYVPVEWLKKGKNDILILELLKPEQSELKGITTPILDVLKLPGIEH